MKKEYCKNYIRFLYEQVTEIITETIDDNLLNDIFEVEIFKKVFKSLVYAMNMERIEGRLKGKTAEERYAYFSDSDYCIEVMKKLFPDMQMQITSEIKDKILYVQSVINEFQISKKKIENRIFKHEVGDIKKIKCAGDWHNNKCVLILEFKKGEKVVYKATIGDNIQFLKGILKNFFDKEYLDNYIYLRLNSKGVWVKYIEHVTISEREVPKYYFNYGKLMFIAYMLGMNDLHYENLIANGVNPVITDVETIFSSYLFTAIHDYKFDARKKAIEKLTYGVISTGLLPIVSMSEYFGGDISCLSNCGLKLQVEKLKNSYQDNMSIVTEIENINPEKHLPNFNINPLYYKRDIVAGFKKAEKIFKNKMEEIFKYIEINMDLVESRIILNMTKSYSKMLRIKSDPKYRYDSSRFENLLKKMGKSYHFNERTFEYESLELKKDNIPSFYWNNLEKRIYGKEGLECFGIRELKYDFLKIKQLVENQVNEKVIEYQIKLIEDSIDSMLALGIQYRGEKIQSELLKANEDIVLIEDITSNKISGNDGTVNWIGLMVNEKEQLEYAVLDWSLYSGMIGIGYAYYAKYILEADSGSVRILRELFNSYEIYLNSGEFNTMNISYYTGLTGMYAFWNHFRKENILDEEKLNLVLDKILQLIRKNILHTNVYDTLAGVHSAVIYWYSQYIETKESFIKEILILIKEHWKKLFELETMTSEFNFASFAHGFSGIITSLLMLNKVTPEEDLKSMIGHLIKEEYKLYKENYKWIDKRNKEIAYADFWCHGSCGIMFSRLLWLKYELIDNISKLEHEVWEYRKKILSGSLDTKNSSLCHGNFAFLDFLISCDAVLKKQVSPEVKDYINKAIVAAKSQGYSCVGAPGAINALGLMVGEAGIQYELVRCRKLGLKSILAIEAL